MRFRILTAEQKAEKQRKKFSEWHRHFAWFPVRMTDNETDVRWLETVYRKGVQRRTGSHNYWEWEYAETVFDILKKQ